MDVFVGNLIKIKAKRGAFHWFKVTDIAEDSILCVSFHDYVLKTENPEVIQVNKKDIIEVVSQ